MRHLGSLAAGLVVTPLAWVLLAYGQGHTYTQWNGNASHIYYWYEPVLFLAAAGLLVGLLASTRISPVGPAIAGVIYLAIGITALAVEKIYKLVPHGFTISLGGIRREFPLRLPIDNGSAVLIGAALLVALVSVGRWRARPKPGRETTNADGATREAAAITAGEPASDEAPTPPTPPTWPTPAEEPVDSRRALDDHPQPHTLTKDEPTTSGSPWTMPPVQGANQD
jgi:hypothetical protein